MLQKLNLNLIILILIPFSFLQAQYELVDAFPNLNFRKPVMMTYSPDSSNRVFVVEQDGRIRVFPNNPDVSNEQKKTFLDITSRIPGGVPAYGEYGLLSMAFHPDFAENGIFYIDYVLTQDSIETYISKYQVSEADSNAADPSSEVVLLQVDQVLENHNAGMMEFGNDGYLYISLGDGGFEWPSGEPDPEKTAQDLTKLLGSILRIDVDNPDDGLEYGIPEDNPFAGNTDGNREEIFAYGFRNPWRFSIDPVKDKIWVGDVGLASWEEVDIVESGKNYGWSQTEGFDCRPGVDCDTTLYEPPVYVYANGVVGCAITGGRVYRGQARPELVGKYIFSDWCNGLLYSLEDNGDSSYTHTQLTNKSNIGISGFGQDENHELYIMSLDYFETTKIYRFKAEPVSSVEPNANIFSNFSLLPNFPNPFNPSTNISYELKSSMDYELAVYDMTGKRIRLLETGNKPAGVYNAVWNGQNDQGIKVGSGMYVIKLSAGNKQIVRKITLLK
jgi:glucose/arabinose dehydrogenase